MDDAHAQRTDGAPRGVDGATPHVMDIGTDAAATVLDAAADRCIAIVGDVMLDRYVTGRVDRISPEAPVPVVHVESDRGALGGAANVAAGVAALGCACRLVGLVGDDDAAAMLARRLAEHGIDPGALVRDAARPTTVKTRILARRHQMLRVDYESTAPASEPIRRAFAEGARRAIDGADVLVLEDYDKGALWPELARALLAEARSCGIPSIVDPKLRHFFEYPGATVFKPNGRELAAALGTEEPPRERAELGEVVTRVACEHLLVTLGECGMLLLEGAVEAGGDGRLHHIPSRAREVFDVTGAGDTVTAVLAAALAGGAEMLEAARLANRAAGIEVSHFGAVPVGREELLAETTSTEVGSAVGPAG